MFMVITCDNVCELLLMERRVTGKPSCTVWSGGKANVNKISDRKSRGVRERADTPAIFMKKEMNFQEKT